MKSVKISSVSYTGPIRGSPQPTGDENIVVQMTTPFTQSSNSGIIANAWTTADVISCTDFNDYVNVYTEYRILGIETEWIPLYGTSVTTPIPGVGAQAVVRGPAGTPATLDVVVQKASFREFRTTIPLKMQWRMSTLEEAVFIPTSTAVNIGGIQTYVDGLAATAVYGKWFTTFRVQFRARR